MLGSLAKWLRILGYDTSFFSYARDDFLLGFAQRENRVLLTKDRALAKNSEISYLVESLTLKEQLKEVVSHFSLKKLDKSRCSVCNGILKDVKKEKIKFLVPPYVFKTHELFLRCTACGRIYWQGTHTERIEKFLNNVLKSL